MLYDKRWDATVVQPLLLEQRILLDAADLLEKDGWCQGVAEDDSGRHCTIGAMGVVQGKLPVDGSSAASYLALSRLRLRTGINGIASWNDAPGRTKEEVVAAMREAAKS